ncbi:MAG: di-trans,poly-cis-decaprenylcistransferase [Planctomycetes bacterium]|nr:di-trans,poly-cis-decaprenylcistransferase [Planctomycetota bacterium]MBL7008068.1 di-trans,poly-cis-decaprenylcistransferase [Planctomycetota bacterium]
MDGNGRWARRHGWKRIRGHESGVEAVRDTVEAAAEWGLRNLTLYSFSVENWQRPRAEVGALMALLRRFLIEERPTLLDNNIRLQAIGRVQDLPAESAAVLRETEALTAGCDGMVLRLALSYGGRQELVEAAQRLAGQALRGELSVEELDEDRFRAALYDPAMPDPDLVIRTAGEQRLSNFLLWQASYAEFHFADELWPDFRRQHLLRALSDYHSRVRRFGRVLDSDPAVRQPR